MTAFEIPKNPRFQNLIGNVYTRLTVVEYRGRCKGKMSAWLCKCECGQEIIVQHSNLKNGHTKSCGCLSREITSKVRFKHGHNKKRGESTPEYRSWMDLKSRCNNPKVRNYNRYGGRGIKVCDRWNEFENFLEDMGLRPSPNHSIDRINNDGNYEPGNCKWSDRAQQGANKSNNIRLVYNGESKTASEWARLTGVKYRTLLCRIKRGWDAERIIGRSLRNSAVVVG